MSSKQQPKSKRLKRDADGPTRIHKKLSMADLKEEAAARGLLTISLPRKKADLLEMLVEGSLCLKETAEWKAFVAVKLKMESERAQLQARILEEKSRKEDEKQARLVAQRQQEIESQRVLHIHSFPRVHSCKLALTTKLQQDGIQRYSKATCEFCYAIMCCMYSCQSCDFDICQECFESKNQEFPKAMNQKRKVGNGFTNKESSVFCESLHDEDDFALDSENGSGKKEVTEYEKSQFTKAAMDPPKKSQDRKSKLGFTVWFSSGYPPDGWHTYEGPPTKIFDSTWKTAEEANLRAKYRFYWKNNWGLSPQQLFDDSDNEMSEQEVNGLITRWVRPEDSEEWTVGVVPDVAFDHLDNATVGSFDDDNDDE